MYSAQGLGKQQTLIHSRWSVCRPYKLTILVSSDIKAGNLSNSFGGSTKEPQMKYNVNLYLWYKLWMVLFYFVLYRGMYSNQITSIPGGVCVNLSSLKTL